MLARLEEAASTVGRICSAFTSHCGQPSVVPIGGLLKTCRFAVWKKRHHSAFQGQPEKDGNQVHSCREHWRTIVNICHSSRSGHTIMSFEYKMTLQE